MKNKKPKRKKANRKVALSNWSSFSKKQRLYYRTKRLIYITDGALDW